MMNQLVAYDVVRQLLVHDTDAALGDKVCTTLPGARRLTNGYVATPVSLYNLQVLSWLGLPVIKLMDREYDWPINPLYKPLAHQKQMANFMALNPRSFNLSDPGTMKTLATLWAADYVMRQYPKGQCRCLIVCTLSTMQRVWADALFQHMLGRRTFVILRGNAAKRRKLLAEPHDFYIVNYEGLSIGAPSYDVATRQWSQPTDLYQDVLLRSDIRIAVIDEASAYRDHTTQRHRVARSLLQSRDYLWLLTGTPCSKGPLNAYGLHRLIHPRGESFFSYRSRVAQPIGYRWEPLPGATAEAFKLLQPAIRYAINECVELPPNTVQFRDCELSPAQKQAMQQLRREAALVLNQQTISAVNEAVLRLKLIQIACGAIYGPDRTIHRVDALPRIRVVKEIIEESDDKFIVFAPFTSVLHLLKQELPYDTELVYGGVSERERARIFSVFQNSPDIRGIIADPGTMAHGLTLTAASFIIWYAPTDKTEIYLQANKRIDRPGQTKSTVVYQLAGTAVEREIYKRNAREQSLQGLILQMVKDLREA
jgi:SNF2 family DNA or RNA helicase